MTAITDLIANSLDVRGKITNVVIQGTSPQFANFYTKNGQPRQVRTYTSPINPKTPAQLAQQAKMRAAVAAWQAATDEDKAKVAPIAKNRAITLYMAFLSEYIKNYIAPTGTTWDSDSTTWDSGNTTWD